MRATMTIISVARVWGFACSLAAIAAAATAADSLPVSIRVDAAKTKGELKPIWRFFGADEPNYAYMKHGQKLVGELGELRPKQVYFRAHNLLTSGDGTPALKWGSTGVYREDADGKPIYDWTILDRIFDTYLERGVRPYAQIGFMPKDLSIKPEPYQHQWTPRARYDEIYTGWAYPPKDYDKWARAGFSVGAALRREVRRERKWRRGIGRFGTSRTSATGAARRRNFASCTTTRLTPCGGRCRRRKWAGRTRRAAAADSREHFFEHCLRGTNYATGKIGTPLDFVAFHAKGSPTYVDGHVRMGIANQLRTIDDGFRIVASYPELKRQADRHRRIRSRRLRGVPGAAARLSQRHDVFELHGGQLRPQARPGRQARRESRRGADVGVRVRGPALFRGLSLAGHQRHRQARAERVSHVQQDGRPSGWPWRATMPCRSTRSSGSGVREPARCVGPGQPRQEQACVLVWHYHDDDVAGPAADVELAISGLPPQARQRSVNALSHRRRSQQRVRRLEADGLAAAADGGAIRPARKGGAVGDAGRAGERRGCQW